MNDIEQTSEDELRAEILTEFKQVHRLAPADYTENCTNVVMSIIRTEKLKLLAEVRERVVQSLPDTAFHGTSIRVKEKIRDGGYHDGVLDSRLATEETLTKLEALYGKDEK